MTKPLPIVVEEGTRRTFAAVLDWPGWCRPGRDLEAALAELHAHAARYEPIVRAAGLTPPSGSTFEIVETIPGDASTDFGAPGKVARAERGPLQAAEGARLATLLEATWAHFERVVDGAPAGLRKGPRGGGREAAEVRRHVEDAEDSYARRVGVKVADPRERRRQIAALFRAGVEPEGRWPLRYLARRVAWHVLDHAWEIENRSGG